MSEPNNDLKKPSAPRPTPSVTHTVRTSSGGRKTIRMTRGLAIKLMCTECLGWEGQPKECPSTLCPLYPYRGKTLKTLDT